MSHADIRCPRCGCFPTGKVVTATVNVPLGVGRHHAPRIVRVLPGPVKYQCGGRHIWTVNEKGEIEGVTSHWERDEDAEE